MQTENTGSIEAEEKNEKAAYGDYAELWNYNLQKIEQIGHSVEKSIHDLEGNYAGFESMYAGIMRQLDVLSSIYSGYNTLGGAEDVMRLKAVLHKYAAMYTREGLDFNLVHYLLTKISDARDASFENFPALDHHDPPRVAPRRAPGVRNINEYDYRWISFRRGHSWFIARFTSLRIYLNDSYPARPAEEPDFFNVEIRGTSRRVQDLLAISAEDRIEPCYYLVLDRGDKNYAADEIGKRIYAPRNFLGPRIRPFRSIRSHPLSPGRVRLFGKNHIVLN